MAVSSYKRIYEAPTENGSLAGYYLLLDKSGAASAAKAPVSRLFSQEDAVAAANAIPHGAADLSLAQAMVLASGGAFNIRSYGASPSASAAVNTAAILEAIGDAAGQDFPATVIVPAGFYPVLPDSLVVSASHVTLQGTDSYRSQLYCASPGTILKIEKNAGADVIYDVNIRDIAFNGGDVATVGVAINNLSELVWRNVGIYNCATGMTIKGQFCGNYHFHDLLVANCSVNGISYIANSAYAVLQHVYDGGNFYNCPVFVKFWPGSSAYNIRFLNINFELFTTAFLFAESTTAPIVTKLDVIGNYFQTYSASGSAVRLFRFTANDATAPLQATNIICEGNHIATNDAAYVMEADLNTYHAGSVITAWMRNNRWVSGGVGVAWVKSDVSTPLHHIVTLESNQAGANEADQDGVTAQILGFGAPNVGYQYMNTVKGPLGYGAPVVLTANSISPSVRRGTLFETANTAGTDYYGFNDGTLGQQIIVFIKDAFSSFDFTSSNLIGNGGANWTAASGDWIEAIYDGSKWRCSIHVCT